MCCIDAFFISLLNSCRQKQPNGTSNKSCSALVDSATTNLLHFCTATISLGGLCEYVQSRTFQIKLVLRFRRRASSINLIVTSAELRRCLNAPVLVLKGLCDSWLFRGGDHVLVVNRLEKSIKQTLHTCFKSLCKLIKFLAKQCADTDSKSFGLCPCSWQAKIHIPYSIFYTATGLKSLQML